MSSQQDADPTGRAQRGRGAHDRLGGRDCGHHVPPSNPPEPKPQVLGPLPPGVTVRAGRPCGTHMRSQRQQWLERCPVRLQSSLGEERKQTCPKRVDTAKGRFSLGLCINEGIDLVVDMLAHHSPDTGFEPKLSGCCGRGQCRRGVSA